MRAKAVTAVILLSSSPQPPSGFCCAASQASPSSIESSISSSVAAEAVRVIVDARSSVRAISIEIFKSRIVHSSSGIPLWLPKITVTVKII